MSRPPIPYWIARVALVELAEGARVVDAARAAGISPRSVDRLIDEHGRMTLRETKLRADALTLEEREEIRIGIDRDESNTKIAERLGRDRSTVWREIKANGGRESYRAFKAQDRAHQALKRVRPTWVQTRAWLWDIVVRHMRDDK
ncbi:MAG: helix-turn-helix domain-containing protein, partial [Actinomycetota bacterium]|nr:helix-turn-helix domain-containing protein [Actinomycetota bacterium]